MQTKKDIERRRPPFPRSFDELRHELALLVLEAAIVIRRKLTPNPDERAGALTGELLEGGAATIGERERPHDVVIDGGPFRYSSMIESLRWHEFYSARRYRPVSVPRFSRESWNRFDPIIARVASRHAVPAEIVKAVIATESSFNPTAIREEPRISDRSRGLMQILERTARGLGFHGTFGALYDPEVNISLGTRLLADLHERYQNWPDALAAYNGGTPRKDSKGELVPILAAYVGKVTRRIAELRGEVQPKTAASKGIGAVLGTLALFFLFRGGRFTWKP